MTLQSVDQQLVCAAPFLFVPFPSFHAHVLFHVVAVAVVAPWLPILFAPFHDPYENQKDIFYQHNSIRMPFQFDPFVILSRQPTFLSGNGQHTPQ
jgi:hypothetical protein